MKTKKVWLACYLHIIAARESAVIVLLFKAKMTVYEYFLNKKKQHRLQYSDCRVCSSYFYLPSDSNGFQEEP